MSERRGRERIFEIDPVKRPKGRFLRLLVAKYVGWVEVFGYIFCAMVAAGIIACWVYRVDEIAKEKEVGKSLIKPREGSLTHAKDAIVTTLLVKEWQHVTDLDAVVEVCDDPAWVLRCKAIQRLDAFAKDVRELEKEGTLPAGLITQAANAEKEVDTWNKSEAKKGPRIVLRAPFEGDVTGTQDIEGKFFKASDAVCKVVDFTNLRLSVKLSGTNVERVRVGMPVKVKVVPDYGLGCVLRGDARLGWLKSERLQFNYTLDGKDIKAFLLDWWKKHPVVADEDTKRGVALTPAEIEEVEITCALQAEPLPESEAEKVPESLLVEVDQIAAKNPLRAIVVEGKHTGTYTTNYLDSEVRKELAQRVNQGLKNKVARPVGDKLVPPLRLLEASNVRNYLKLKASVSDLTMEDTKPKPAPATKPGAKEPPAEITVAVADQRATGDAEWKVRRAGMDERLALAAASGVDVDKGDRFFEGVVRLNNPSPLLSQKVKEAYVKSPAAFLKAKVEVVVGECRLAMLLFRQ